MTCYIRQKLGELYYLKKDVAIKQFEKKIADWQHWYGFLLQEAGIQDCLIL